MKKENDIFNTLKKETLTESERALLKSRLHEYRAFKPLRPAGAAQQRPFFPLFPFSFARPAPLIASLAVLVVAGGGVAQAAEQSLPGDFLYPIKTAVNEEVRVALAADAEAKAETEAWLAERRLLEAQQLASRASLTVDKKERLEENFTEHARRVEERVAIISEEDPALAADLATKFEASLTAHEAILSALDSKPGASLRDSVKERIANIAAQRRVAALSATGETVAALSAEIAVTALPAALDEEKNEEPVEEMAALKIEEETNEEVNEQAREALRAAERMQRSARKTLEKTEKTFNKKRDILTEDERARIENQFARAKDLLARGESEFQKSAHRDAFNTFQEVVLSMETLNILLRTDANFGNRARIIDIETIGVHSEIPNVEEFIPPASFPKVELDIDIDLE